MDDQQIIQFEPKEPNRNKIQVFTNPQFGEIRTAGTPDEPLFCLADVCQSIGISNARNVRTRIDEEDVHQMDTLTNGGIQSVTYITESGLYDVIIRSDSPNAKPFRRWVTTEVLPSIRKHGGYIAVHQDDSPEMIMAKALQIADATIKRTQQQLKAAEERNKLLEPKAAWTDYQIGNDEMLYGWEQAAKHLKLRSAKKITTFCLDHEFVYRRYDSKNKRWDYYPHANFTEQGYFRVIQETPKHRDGTPVINQYTGQPCNPKRELKITEYGLVFLQSQLEKAGLVKPIFSKNEQ